jgi:hypothetical protein
MICPPETCPYSPTAPESSNELSVTWLPVHLAYKVIAEVSEGEYGNVIAAPPSVADHPANVNPSRVGSVGAAEIDPPVVKDPLVTAVPPFESYVTVFVFPVQLAYRGKSPVIVTEARSA